LKALSVLLAVAAILVIRPQRATSAQYAIPMITAPAAIVIDGWSGTVLYQKNASSLRYPASTSKIMAALVILRRHIPLQRVVTVSPYAASIGGSTAGLFAGERMNLWNLLHGLLLPSGNDAAIALAEAVSGTEARFVALMNRQARRLHLWHTHYVSPDGFDAPGQITTPRDLATLARVAMGRSRFARIARTRFWTARSSDGRSEHRWVNLNKLLWMSRRVDGVKTGTTPGAGACLVASAHWRGRWIIEVNMGSTYQTRFDDGMKLLDYGFSIAASPPSTD